ncbi:hypothetical protein [Nonomuraea sp. KM88]|uniref:hypothetical protein n=1 Tax=Nonomuraea sp. KM88 TaxID=3457427 RepID=UPI003FCD5CE7
MRAQIDDHPHQLVQPDTAGELGPASKEAGSAVLYSGYADLVSYGRAFLATPDLPARFARNAARNSIDTGITGATYDVSGGSRVP